LKRKTAIIAAESDDISDGSAARASTCSWEEDVEPTEPCDLNLRFSFSKDFFGLKKSHQFISKSIASTALYYVTLEKYFLHPSFSSLPFANHTHETALNDSEHINSPPIYKVSY
jgi:hypothetical protein